MECAVRLLHDAGRRPHRYCVAGKSFLFADRGDFVAKGFEEPVRISEVNWRS